MIRKTGHRFFRRDKRGTRLRGDHAQNIGRGPLPISPPWHAAIGAFAGCNSARGTPYRPAPLPLACSDRPMQRTPSKPKRAVDVRLAHADAGDRHRAREATRELNVFQLMRLRSLLGFVLLISIIHFNGGLAIVKTARFRTLARNLVTHERKLAGSNEPDAHVRSSYARKPSHDASPPLKE